MNDIRVGNVLIFTGNGEAGTHSVEQLAEMMLGKLIFISETSMPKPVLDQVQSGKDRIRVLFIEYLKKAQEAERRRIVKKIDRFNPLRGINF